MKLNEYQEQAQRTATDAKEYDKCLNGILGLNGEVGELTDGYKKIRFQGHVWVKEWAIEELGDILWYVAEVASAIGVTLEDVAQQNIEKLKERYPDGFHQRGDM